MKIGFTVAIINFITMFNFTNYLINIRNKIAINMLHKSWLLQRFIILDIDFYIILTM